MSTDTHSPDSRTERPAPRERPRPDGQWALGDRTPLNANEEWKAREGGLAVRERVVEHLRPQGFATIPADDLRGRMRWWGLYTQRRPGDRRRPHRAPWNRRSWTTSTSCSGSASTAAP